MGYFGYWHKPGEISKFEELHGITLPKDYAEYILSHPTGDQFEISLLSNWAQPFKQSDLSVDFLKTAFPHSECWNDVSLFDESLGWESEYYSMKLVTGSIRISNLGCESYALLVVSGPQRGTIWIDKRASTMLGIYPCIAESGKRASLSEFLELKLNSSLF